MHNTRTLELVKPNAAIIDVIRYTLFSYYVKMCIRKKVYIKYYFMKANAPVKRKQNYSINISVLITDYITPCNIAVD